MRARSLLSAPGQSYVCDAKCETQVCAQLKRLARSANMSLWSAEYAMSMACLLAVEVMLMCPSEKASSCVRSKVDSDSACGEAGAAAGGVHPVSDADQRAAVRHLHAAHAVHAYTL